MSREELLTACRVWWLGSAGHIEYGWLPCVTLFSSCIAQCAEEWRAPEGGRTVVVDLKQLISISAEEEDEYQLRSVLRGADRG